jgi:hypothetical protein
MFSSLEVESRRTVIKQCYWPILNLSAEGYRIGVEMTGYTLELIMSLDPLWVEKFKILLNDNKIELIGSGYTQVIGPLVPSEVNDWNQKLGMEMYYNLLGVKPKIVLVNEMAFSSGIIEHYINNGYKAIIMEWNNPRKYHPEWDNQCRYYAQKAINQQGIDINLIWADSIAFQKFQRYAHGEMSIDSYFKYLESHQSSELRFFPFYTSDAEVFDYRPGRFKTEVTHSLDISEWNRIEILMKKISQSEKIKFVLPSEVIDGKKNKFGGQILSLESTEQPIPVKKQNKYNINRWALTGRNDIWLNTICYKFYEIILELNQAEYWRKLCFLWSSDFRTHITSKRWEKLLDEVKIFAFEIGLQEECNEVEKEIRIEYDIKKNDTKKINYKQVINSHLELIFNLSKGCLIHSYKPYGFEKSIMGTIEHGYFEDIEYGVDFFTGHTVIEQLGKHKITDLAYSNYKITEKEDSYTLSSDLLVDKIRFENTTIIEKGIITLIKKISLPFRDNQIIHPFHFTFISDLWDIDSLYFATHNGSNFIETFQINNQDFDHGDNHSFLISAKHGLGNTKGEVIIGDKDKKLVFKTKLKKSFLIPSILYKIVDGDKFLLRLTYSAQEIDETFRTSQVPESIIAQISVNCISNHL